MIEFTVTQDDILTSLTIGHNFNGCSGTQTFTDLQISTAGNVECIGFQCPSSVTSYRSLDFTTGGDRSIDQTTTVHGLFLPSGRAEGAAFFRNFPGCGDAENIGWTARRR